MENTVITFDSFSKFQEVIRNAKSLPFNRAILNGNVKDLKHQVGKCLEFILENVFEYTDRDLYEDISENGYIIEYSLADDTER